MNKGEIFNLILSALPKTPDANYRYWTNGTDILCKTEEECNTIAGFLDAMLNDYSFARTGYYDPDADFKSGKVYKDTGYYYVDID